MMTTMKAAFVALLRMIGFRWAVRLADRIDPPSPPPDFSPEGGGGAGPVVPPPRPK